MRQLKISQLESKVKQDVNWELTEVPVKCQSSSQGGRGWGLIQGWGFDQHLSADAFSTYDNPLRQG